MIEEDVKSTARTLVAAVLQRAGVWGPPVDPQVIADAFGVDIFEKDMPGARGYYLEAAQTVFVAPQPRAERAAFTVAHELGEHLAPTMSRLLGAPLEQPLREHVCDLIAGYLLCPPEWFSRDCHETGFDLLTLKEIYATASHEVIARRMLETDVPTTITVIDNGRISRRLSNSGTTPRWLAPAEREAVKAAGKGEPCERVDDHCRVQAWPVNEARWKRVILRTTVDDWGPG